MPTLQLSLLTILHHVLLISQSFNSTFRKYGRHNYFRKVSHFYSSLWEARITTGIFLRSSRPIICLFATSEFVMWLSLAINMQYNSCFNITITCNVIVLLTHYCAGDEIENNEMGWAFGTYGWGEGVYRVLVGKPERKRPLGRPRRRWVDNIRMDLQEVGCGYMDWIGLAQDRDGWRTLVSAVMNLGVPWNAGNFLTSCKPVSFSRRTAPWSK